MKKLLLAYVSLAMCFLTPFALGGSGAGGQIRVKNNSSKTVYVTFRGVGCGGIKYQVDKVCDAKTIAPGRTGEYKYNWGVTTTWIQIASNKVGWVSEKSGLVGTVLYSPCAPVTNDDKERSEAKKYCYVDKKIKTKAHKWSEYTFNG